MRTIWVAFALLALSQSAFAQVPVPPGAGDQIRHVPPAPVRERAIPDIRVDQRDAPGIEISDQVRILVRALRVTGQTLIPKPSWSRSLSSLRVAS